MKSGRDPCVSVAVGGLGAPLAEPVLGQLMSPSFPGRDHLWQRRRAGRRSDRRGGQYGAQSQHFLLQVADQFGSRLCVENP